MTKSLAILILLAGTLPGGAAWRPDAKLLNAVCQIESSGGRAVYGDGGRSLGHYQFQKAAWSDVSEWRKKRNQPTYDYRQNVFNARISRLYAADYLIILHDRLQQQYKREPSSAELYAAYNMGMNSFRKCNYNLARVNKTTEARCKLLVALVN
ncbi:MAG: transglycosylase SLT domain-containing protein [Verrucomicrobiota bacterium]